MRRQGRDSRGCGVQVLAPKQSGEQGVLCLWAAPHLWFCLPGCDPGGAQIDVTEKGTWLQGWGAGGVLEEKDEQQGEKHILMFSHE